MLPPLLPLPPLSLVVPPGVSSQRKVDIKSKIKVQRNIHTIFPFRKVDDPICNMANGRCSSHLHPLCYIYILAVVRINLVFFLYSAIAGSCLSPSFFPIKKMVNLSTIL